MEESFHLESAEFHRCSTRTVRPWMGVILWVCACSTMTEASLSSSAIILDQLDMNIIDDKLDKTIINDKLDKSVSSFINLTGTS
jgi:hypothetical protein